MNGILMALFGTLGTFLITALGAAGIFFVRREVSGNLQLWIFRSLPGEL